MSFELSNVSSDEIEKKRVQDNDTNNPPETYYKSILLDLLDTLPTDEAGIIESFACGQFIEGKYVFQGRFTSANAFVYTGTTTMFLNADGSLTGSTVYDSTHSNPVTMSQIVGEWKSEGEIQYVETFYHWEFEYIGEIRNFNLEGAWCATNPVMRMTNNNKGSFSIQFLTGPLPLYPPILPLPMLFPSSMMAVFHDIQSINTTNLAVRTTPNQPELRVLAIHQELSNYRRFCFQPTSIELNENSAILQVIHSADLLNFLAHGYESWNRCDLDYCFDDGLVPYNFFRAHDSYQRFAQRIPLWKLCGYFADDFRTPLRVDSFKQALISASNSIAAVDSKYKLCYCLNSSPGHHASFNHYGGYCFLNNGALSVAELHSRYPKAKIAILDLDYHYGNGTAEILQRLAWKEVLCVSIHADPTIEYPTFSGFRQDTSNILSIPLPAKTDFSSYSANLRYAMSKIHDFGVEYLVIPFGCDTLSGDEDNSILGGFLLEVEEYRYLAHIIMQRRACFRKIIITQEGGYSMDRIPRAVYEFLNGFLDLEFQNPNSSSSSH